MSEYDGQARPLSWDLRNPLVASRTTEDDGDFPPSSFVWPEDSDERVPILFYLSLNEYNVLGSTIDVGSDIAYGIDAIRVTWLWLRNFRIEVPMPCCDDILAALANQDALNTTTQVTQRAMASQALRDALEAEYTGNPTSINPNAPTTDFGSSGDRFDALCAGLMAFVYQFARAQADSVRAGQVGGLAAIALIAALLIPGLNIFFLVGASIAVLLGLGTVGVTTEIAIQALTDAEALDLVVCCMRDNLKDESVSEANWLTALGGCGFESGSHAQIVADFISPTLGDNYLTILNILGQAYTGVIDGEQLPECPCAPPPPQDCYDLQAAEHSFIPYFNGFVYYAAYSAGNGFEPDYNPGIINFRRADMGGTVVKATVYFSEAMPEGINNTVGALNYNYTGGAYVNDVEGDSVEIPGLSLTSGLMIDLTFDGTLPSTFYVRRVCVQLEE